MKAEEVWSWLYPYGYSDKAEVFYADYIFMKEKKIVQIYAIEGIIREGQHKKCYGRYLHKDKTYHAIHPNSKDLTNPRSKE